MSADKGLTNAILICSFHLSEGIGVEVNKEETARYLKIGSDQGCTDAMVNYAHMLFTGDGIPVNKEEEIRYIKTAAEKGNLYGMFNKLIWYIIINPSIFETNQFLIKKCRTSIIEYAEK